MRHNDLSHASLRGANFTYALLYSLTVKETDFREAVFSRTSIAATDLSVARNLARVVVRGPNSVCTDTLRLSKGRLPERLLGSEERADDSELNLPDRPSDD